MLKPALEYAEELKEKYIKEMYDLRNQFYYGWYGTKELELSDNNYDRHEFVSVDEDDNIIGFISYNICYNRRIANDFGILSFDKGNLTFPRDLSKMIHDIFCTYNLDKMVWRCFEDNPALRGYRNFIKKHGGRQRCYALNESILMDGKLHHMVEFELSKEDYIDNPERGEVSLHYSIQQEINKCVEEKLRDMLDRVRDYDDSDEVTKEALKGYLRYLEHGNDAIIVEVPKS